MPIARARPRSEAGPPNEAGHIRLSDVPAGENLAATAAVAIVQELGGRVVRPCGALTANHAKKFVGFTRQAVAAGDPVTIITGRGSEILVLVEGGGPLTVGSPVYLSLTPGRVTQTAPTASGSVTLPLGYATTTTKILFAPDYRVNTP